MRKLGLLLAGTVALWFLVFLPARFLLGDRALVESVVAAVLCLVPMMLTLLWCLRAQGGTVESQLAAAMAGTGVRLLTVLAGAVILFLNVEALGQPSFMILVVLFYVATLALEILLLVRQINTGPRPGA
jgi:hypothetical protein